MAAGQLGVGVVLGATIPNTIIETLMPFSLHHWIKIGASSSSIFNLFGVFSNLKLSKEKQISKKQVEEPNAQCVGLNTDLVSTRQDHPVFK